MSKKKDEACLDKLLISYNDMTNKNIWHNVMEVFLGRLPFRNLIFENKVKKSTQVEELQIEFLHFKNHKIQRLKQYQGLSSIWFQLPYSHLIIVNLKLFQITFL